MKIGSFGEVWMLTFLAYSVSAITFAKKIATDDRISASEDYINKFIKLLF